MGNRSGTKWLTHFIAEHPYCSWERGLNENTNGLIRQFFPKKFDFKTISDDDVKRVMDLLNNRPRKSLGLKTPNQVFWAEIYILQVLHLLIESTLQKRIDMRYVRKNMYIIRLR